MGSDEEAFEVEKIVERRAAEGGGFEYLTRWKGFSEDEDTWEPISSFESCLYIIEAFDHNLGDQAVDEMEVDLEELDEKPDPAIDKAVATFSELFSNNPNDCFSVPLIKNVQKLQNTGKIHLLPVQHLTSLLTSGATIIHDASKNLFFAAGSQSEVADDDELTANCQRLIHVVNIAKTILRVLTADHIARTLFREEVVKELLDFVWFHTQNHVFPMCDDAACQQSAVAKKLTALGDVATPKSQSGQKKRKKAATSSCGLFFSMLRPFRLLQEFCELWEFISVLVSKSKLQDGVLLQLTEHSLKSMTFSGTESIQLSVIPLISTVYRDYGTHRANIVSQVVDTLAETVSMSKKAVYTYRVSGGQSIMMLSALILQMTQGLALHHGNEYHGPTNLTILASIKKECHRMIDKLFFRCTVKPDKLDPDSNILARVQGVVDDLLTVWQHPDWIAGEWCLDRVMQCIMMVFTDKEGSHKLRKAALQNGCDMELRKLCLSLAGSVAAKLKSGSSELAKISPQSLLNPLAKQEVPEQSEMHGEDLPCQMCGSLFDEGDLTQKLVVMFGGNVLVDGSWVDLARGACFNCQIRLAVHDQIQESRPAQEQEETDHTAHERTDTDHAVLLMTLLQNYFWGQSGSEAMNAGCCHRLQWMADLENHPDQQVALSQTAQNKKHQSSKRRVVLPFEEAQSVCALLSEMRLSSGDKSLSSSNIIDGLAMLLQDDLPAIRARAIKAIKMIVDADHTVLAEPRVKAVMAKCIHDRNISVREASLDVIGTHMMNSTDLIEEYHPVIAERVRDVGTSVRKRAVQIFHGILTAFPNIPRATDVCSTLVKCIGDEEESIQKLVMKTFEQLWFCGLADLKARGTGIEIVTEQVVAVVDASSGADWLKPLLEKLVKGESKSAKDVKAVCAAIANQLADNADAALSEAQQLKQLAVLSLLGEVRGEFVSRHIATLQVHLADTRLSSSSDEDSQKIIAYVANIINCGLPHIKTHDIMLLEGIEKSLGVILISTGRSSESLQNSAQCLCTVVNQGTSNFPLIEELLQRFYYFAENHSPVEGQTGVRDPAVRGLIRRYIYMMGVLCKYHDFDRVYEGRDSVAFGESNEEDGSKRLQVGNVATGVLKVLYRYFTSQDIQFQRWALQSMGALFCRSPNLIRTKAAAKVFHASFLSSDATIRIQNLNNICDFVEDQLAEMRKQQERNNSDADSGLSSALMQQYLEHILKACLEKDQRLRLAGISIVRHIVGQSFVAPFQCVPHLIAVACDVEPKLSDIAHTLLQTVHEKRAEFCADSHAMQGVDLAFMFRRHLHMGPEESMALMLKDGHVGIKRLYQLLRGQRSHRMNFLQALVHRIGSFNETPDQRPSISYSIFLAQQLTNLPYSVREEPLFVIYTISHVLALHRDTILFELSKETEDSEEDGETGVPPTDRVSLKEIAAVCILILVKQHLKDVHYLSDIVCEEFKPSTGTKVTEKALPHFSDREEPVLDLQCIQTLMNPETRETRESAYHLLKELVDNDLSKDFSLDQRKPKARKRKSTSGTPGEEADSKTPGTNGKGSSQKRRPSSKKKKRKRMTLESDDEDDDDDDDDSDF